MAGDRKMWEQWKDWRFTEPINEDSKAVKAYNEEHTITFSKEEMAQLHNAGQIEKDGHTYVYMEN